MNIKAITAITVLLGTGLVMAGAEKKEDSTLRQAQGPSDQDWPQWRGPNRDGVVVNSPKLLDAWPKDGPPLVWTSDFIPAWRDGGCSAPVVADGKVFVYANKQPKDGGAAFKYVTGEVLEHLKTKNLPPDQMDRIAKWKDADFTNIGDLARELRGIKECGLSHHFAMGATIGYMWGQSFAWMDTVYCLDVATGKQLWKKTFPVDKTTLKVPVQWACFENMGASATPAVWNGKIYVVGSAGLYCLSAKDGSLLWQVKSGPEHASPLVTDGIVFHCGVAYDAETGSVKWKNPLWVLGDGKHLKDEAEGRYCAPILWQSGAKKYILSTDGHNKGDLSVVCLELETGKVAWTVKCYTGFNTVGLIRDDILVEGMQENGASSHGFKITPTGAEMLWKGRFNLNGMTGSLIYRDFVYGNHGNLICASLKTGELKWKAGRPVCAPEVAADGKIFGSQDSAGYSETVSVGMFRATPDQYEMLGSFNPEAITMCPVVVANGKLYVRTKDRIACYDIQDHSLYLDGVTATQDKLTFRFQQTGGGLTGSLAEVLITKAGGAPMPAKARIDGDSILVDLEDVSVPFSISCGATNGLASRNGRPVPAFGWDEARALSFQKAFDNSIVLTASYLPLQQGGAWGQAATYAVTGAKVTAVDLYPLGKGVRLTTDKSWKPGETLRVMYPPFQVDQGEPRRATVNATVAEVQRAAARFVKSDTMTSGDWKGKYGAEGVMVAGDRNTNEAPKCATVELRNCGAGTRWAQSDKDPTHLQFTGEQQGRSVQEWMAGDQIFVDVELTDGKEHQFAMQIGCNRALSVTVLDADTKAVLDTQNIPENAGFRYLVWNLKGNVMLHALNLGSAEASPVCIGGLFIDPAGGAAK